jgi:hypothetical protein
VLGLIAMPAWAQGNGMSLDDAIRGYESAAHQTLQGVPDDWSHHHVVFSRPEPGSEAEYRVQQDPRYWLQQIKEKMPAAAAASGLGSGSDFGVFQPAKNKHPKKSKAKLKNDWSVNMGTGAKVGPGQYPAKFSLSPNSTPNCTTDYVAFNTGLAGATAVAATGTGTFANNTSVAGNTVVINGVTLTATGIGTDAFSGEPAVTGATTIIDGVTYNWATTCSAANCIVRSITASTDASHLVAAINNTCGSSSVCVVSGANPGATAVISSSSTSTVVVTNTTGGSISWSLGGTSAQTLSPASSISAASTSGLNFALSSNTTTSASNLATAIDNNSATDGVTDDCAAAVVTVTATTAGAAGNSIATTDTMPGFSWAGTTLAGGTNGQASILAFNNLYATTCSSTVPAVYWAYNTGTGATVATSPVLSSDGSQIAFIQSSSGGVASLVLLKWAASSGTIAAPVSPASVAAASYPTCTAPCMTAIAFGNGHNDTNSFPFYDYSGSDLLFAGDNSGDLHKFQHVFNGSASTPPAEVTTGGFPATVSASGEALTTPVYDNATGEVFVGEAHTAATTTDGKFYWVNSSGTKTTSGPAGAALCHGSGFLDGPVLDPSAGASGTLYIGCGYDDGGGNCTALAHGCIRQFPESFAANAVGTGEPIGTNADVEIFAGAFDHTYLSAATPTGNYYVIGNPGGAPTLYRVPIANNVISAPTAITTTLSSTSGAAGSPITEFYNSATSTDWLFMGTTGTGHQTGCATAGCVYSFNATTALAAGATAAAGISSPSGSSGIVVDNASSTATNANVYFSILGSEACGTGGTGGCAIQAAQSGL